MTLTPATRRLRNAAAPIEHALQRYICPIYGVAGRRGSPVGSGFLLRLSAATLLVTASHVLQRLRQVTLQIPAGQRTVPIEGDPYASRMRLVKTREDGSEVHDFGHDVAFVVLDEKRMLASPSTPALTPTDLDADELPEPRTAYGFAGFPGSVNRSHNGQFDARSYFYGGTAAEASAYQRLGYELATHFIMNFDHQNMIEPSGDEAVVPGADGMSGGPVFRLGAFDEITSGNATPRVVGITIEWYPDRKLLVAVRIGLLTSAIHQLVPHLASDLPMPRYVASIVRLAE